MVIWVDSDSLHYKTCFDNSAPLPPSLPSTLQLATWSNNYNLLYWHALFSIHVALPRGRGGEGGGGRAFQEILMSRVFFSLKINFISICVVHNCRLAVILHIKNSLLSFSLQDIPNTNSVITKMWITRLKLVRSLISCKENLGWVSKIIHDYIGFALLCSLIGQKTHTTLSRFWLSLCKFSLAPTGNFPSPDWLQCLLWYWFYNIQSNSTLSVNKPNLSIYHVTHTSHLERFFFVL